MRKTVCLPKCYYHEIICPLLLAFGISCLFMVDPIHGRYSIQLLLFLPFFFFPTQAHLVDLPKQFTQAQGLWREEGRSSHTFTAEISAQCIF